MRILLLFLFLAFSATTPAIAQEGGPTGTITTEDDATTDAAIAQRLRDILSELGGYEDVTVTVSSGIVTFRGTTNSPEATARLTAIAGRIEGVVAIENEVTETGDVMRRLDPVRERLEERIATIITLTPLLAIAVSVFLIVVLLGFFLAKRSIMSRFAPNAFIADIYRMVIRIVFVIVGIVLALDILDATALLSTILGAAGIIGLAVGFAVRDTVENFIASIMLSLRQPFRPNDAVEINGDSGLVIRLTSRATILLSFDGNHIRIPNATVFKSRILNYSTNPQRRFMFEIGIAPNADLAAMRHLAEDTVAALDFTLSEPAPSVWTTRIGDGAIILT
ncbi:MAG: mechanosensitive ion channel domain-containing protein, partial [Pseudomonadota bacterium]